MARCIMKPLATLLIPVIVLTFSSVLFAQEQADIKVENIVICTSVEDRQPEGTGSVFSADVGRLYCYTKIISHADPSVISHVWFYGDLQMAKVDLAIRAGTWRTWSSKNILPHWRGDWRVEVQDSSGEVISQISFKVE